MLDDDMRGGLGGLEVARRLTRELSGLRVVVYTLDAQVCAKSSGFGAMACLTKDVAPEVLLRTIRDAAAKPIP